MRMRLWQYHPILCLLLLVGASLPCAVSTWAQTSPASFSFPRSMPAAAGATRIDFDDDRVSDPLTFSDQDGHPDIEIYLSATQTLLTLPIDAVADDTGTLAVRDLDSDGDEDLLWQGTSLLTPAEVIVWLNDGTGQFTRVLPPGTLPSQPRPGLSLNTEVHRSAHPPCVVSLQRTSTSVAVVGSSRTADGETRGRYDVVAARPSRSLSFSIPSCRAPPAPGA